MHGFCPKDQAQLTKQTRPCSMGQWDAPENQWHGLESLVMSHFTLAHHENIDSSFLSHCVTSSTTWFPEE